MIEADDVEEIPFDDAEVPAKPERDIQPPKVNTIIKEEESARQAHGTSKVTSLSLEAVAQEKQPATNIEKTVRKESRKLKKAVKAVDQAKLKETVGDESVPLDKIDSESESVPQKDDANDEQDE